jgi:tetratricopeptide (TPR) repeat protein
MKHSTARVGALAVLGLTVMAMGMATGRAQTGQNGQNDESRPSLTQPKPPEPPKDAKPVATPEDNDYQAIFDARNGEPQHVIELGEAFMVKYPDSKYGIGVDSILTPAYMGTDQFDKMVNAGSKVLQMDPDDVDILPLLAWAIPRRVSAKTPDGAQQLQKAQAWARHGIELLSALTKPENLDQAAFEKAKNEKLSMCHDGLGVVDIKTGRYDDAITEITQAMQLGGEPDLVDDFLLGVAQEATNHFPDAIASFNKCATDGPVQQQCKNGIDDTKKKAAKSEEAPK